MPDLPLNAQHPCLMMIYEDCLETSVSITLSVFDQFLINTLYLLQTRPHLLATIMLMLNRKDETK